MSFAAYRLFQSHEEGRFIIAPADHDDYWNCNWITGTHAESWLDAKKRLGFELSAIQEWLLERQMQESE